MADEDSRKRCVICKTLSAFGTVDKVEGFRCHFCDRDEQKKENKKYRIEEFIKNKIPILSIIISSALASIAIIISIMAFYK